ncbi:hypothetical protein DFS34DRAFT_652505 [Phlyctochytrium arcticum]|nr:hypothetical protein DFS34DRAFT_652505 [Phlyctochytrium arcticum]
MPREEYDKLRERCCAELKKEAKSRKGLQAASGATKDVPASTTSNSSTGFVREVETPEEYAKRVAGVTCFQCNNKGHLAKDCPNRARVNATLAEVMPTVALTVNADVIPQKEDPPRLPSRFVQGGRSYADAVTAWQDGQRRVKQEKGSTPMIQEKEKPKGPDKSPTPRWLIPPRIPSAVQHPQVHDKEPQEAISRTPQQPVRDWKEIVGSPTSIGKVFTVLAKVGGADAVLLVDPGAKVQMLDTRFVKLHRFSREDHGQRRKIGTGFRGSYGTSAAGTVQAVDVLDRSDRV